ncbi:MAG: hypothetical protein KME03_09530 [Aphanocapsa lilacina HA4352-LM1]|jgi:tetratricopeptide (TPR) repeat protein|nr:hypothetical protein [Aphanocapsa lilacina HA4352-LM1]
MQKRHQPGWLAWLGAACLAASPAPAPAQAPEYKGPGSTTQQQPQQPASSEEAAKQEAEQKRKIQEAETRNKAVLANNRGVELQKDGKNAEAVEAFREALLVDPTYELAKQNLAASHFNLASEAIGKQQWAVAIENLEAARTYDRSLREKTTVPLAGSYNNQAAELVEAKRLDEAVGAMEKAAELDSKYEEELRKLKDYRTQVNSPPKPGKAK